MSAGARLTIENFQGLEEYHRQLTSKDYKYMKPGLERVEWAPDTLAVAVIDPFYNRIIFNESFK